VALRRFPKYVFAAPPIANGLRRFFFAVKIILRVGLGHAFPSLAEMALAISRPTGAKA
jgi:hypothetical protein